MAAHEEPAVLAPLSEALHASPRCEPRQTPVTTRAASDRHRRCDAEATDDQQVVGRLAPPSAIRNDADEMLSETGRQVDSVSRPARSAEMPPPSMRMRGLVEMNDRPLDFLR